MTGQQLKNEIKKRGYTIKQVALATGMSQQNLGNKLALTDVASSLVEAVAAAMGLDAAELYHPSDTITAMHHSTAIKGTATIADPTLAGAVAGSALAGAAAGHERQLDRCLDLLQKSQLQLDRCQDLLQRSQQQVDTLVKVLQKIAT